MNVRIFVAGVGGQGSVTATAVIGDAALSAGLNVTASEIHGMAQRGGVVESSVVIGDYLSPLVPDRGADILIGLEPVEAARAIRKCGERTVVLLNTHPIIPFTVSLGKEAYPKLDRMLEQLKHETSRVVAFDAFELAREAGNSRATSTVMLGALAGLNRLQISMEQWLAAVLARVPARAVAANEKAFALGFRQTSSL